MTLVICDGSGMCDARRLMERGVDVGLGTDVSGGYNVSLLDAMRCALAVSKLMSLTKTSEYRFLTVHDVFYMATLGGARGELLYRPVFTQFFVTTFFCYGFTKQRWDWATGSAASRRVKISTHWSSTWAKPRGHWTCGRTRAATSASPSSSTWPTTAASAASSWPAAKSKRRPSESSSRNGRPPKRPTAEDAEKSVPGRRSRGLFQRSHHHFVRRSLLFSLFRSGCWSLSGCVFFWGGGEIFCFLSPEN